jgi:hypothetical protein
MADLLESIQRQLRERLDELRPIVSEYERLDAAEKALDGDPAGRPAKADRGDGGESERGRRRRRGGRRASRPASRAATRERVLTIVGERPGITKAELKGAAGLTGAGVAQNLRRLLDRGELREEALPSGDTGYRVDDSAAQSSRGPGDRTTP